MSIKLVRRPGGYTATVDGRVVGSVAREVNVFSPKGWAGYSFRALEGSGLPNQWGQTARKAVESAVRQAKSNA